MACIGLVCQLSQEDFFVRAFRKSNFKEKCFEFGTKILLLAATGLFCLWMVSGAKAEISQITDIRSDNVETNGNQRIVLKFSSPVNKEQVKVDFQRNFIQFSLAGVSAFPARNQEIKSEVLDKVFTYQYQPDLARARILLKEDSQKYKDRTTWNLENNTALVIEIGANNSDLITTRAAATKKTIKSSSAISSVNAVEEEKIVKEILADTKKTNVEDEPLFTHSKSLNKESSEKIEKKESPIKKTLTGLLTVLALMAGLAFGFKKFAQGRGIQLGGGRQGKVIDVISTHMLGAKKSITLVKIGEQYMVLGVTGENINLLSVLGPEAKIEKYLNDQQLSNNFNKTLNSKMNEEDSFAFVSDDSIATTSSSGTGIRDSIKKRLAGFKPL